MKQSPRCSVFELGLVRMERNARVRLYRKHDISRKARVSSGTVSEGGEP